MIKNDERNSIRLRWLHAVIQFTYTQHDMDMCMENSAPSLLSIQMWYADAQSFTVFAFIHIVTHTLTETHTGIYKRNEYSSECQSFIATRIRSTFAKLCCIFITQTTVAFLLKWLLSPSWFAVITWDFIYCCGICSNTIFTQRFSSRVVFVSLFLRFDGEKIECCSLSRSFICPLIIVYFCQWFSTCV